MTVRGARRLIRIVRRWRHEGRGRGSDPTRPLVPLVAGLVDAFGYRRVLEVSSRTSLISVGVHKTAGIDFVGTVVTRGRQVAARDVPAGFDVVGASSDRFFATDRRRFDLIVLDGDSSAIGMRRLVVGSLRCLAPNGTIVIHGFLASPAVSQYVRTIDRLAFDVLDFDYQSGTTLLRPRVLSGPAVLLGVPRDPTRDGPPYFVGADRFVRTAELAADVLVEDYLDRDANRAAVIDAVAAEEHAFRLRLADGLFPGETSSDVRDVVRALDDLGTRERGLRLVSAIVRLLLLVDHEQRAGRLGGDELTSALDAVRRLRRERSWS